MLQLLNVAIGGHNVSAELIDNLTSQGVAPLLEELKVKSALKLCLKLRIVVLTC